MSSAPKQYAEYLTKPDELIGFLVQKDEIITEKDREINQLRTHLIKLQKGVIFGTKSERLSNLVDGELPLFADQIVAPPIMEEPAKVIVPAHTRAARVRRDLSKLPHIRVEHAPESTVCKCCGEELTQIGEEVSKELEYQPAKLFVNEHVRPKLACNHCKGGVTCDPLPLTVKPLERSIAGAGLIAQILVSKYVDHNPLHRQEQIFARLGFAIPRRNMCDWIAGVEDVYLTRLWRALKLELLAESYLQGDETTLKVQDNETPGECHTGYLWGIHSTEKKLVLFEYAPSRAGAVAKDIFADFTGVLQTDAYAGYNKVLLPDKVQRVACLAHVRRKFVESQATCSKEATVVLTMIAALYKFENQWKALDAPAIKKARDKVSKPVLLKLHDYLRELASRTLPKAPLMEAISYTLNQWNAIMRVLDDGRFHLDNNGIEREMRPIAIGRKNYMFAGSHDGARRAAVIYSLLGTARLHKVNPHEWLKDVLTRMRKHPVNRVHELLPHNWTRA